MIDATTVTAIDRATSFCRARYGQKKRSDGASLLWMERVAIAEFLMDLGCDDEIVIAGLLAEIYHDTNTTHRQLMAFISKLGGNITRITNSIQAMTRTKHNIYSPIDILSQNNRTYDEANVLIYLAQIYVRLGYSDRYGIAPDPNELKLVESKVMEVDTLSDTKAVDFVLDIVHRRIKTILERDMVPF